MRNSVQRLFVYRQNLISTFETSILGGRSFIKHGLHVDWQITVRRPVTADYTEAKALSSSLKLNDLYLSPV